MILLIPVLVNLKNYIRNKKQIKYISILSGSIIFVLAISIYLLLLNISTDFNQLEMPAVYAISLFLPHFKMIYGIIILLSIFTTAISDGIAFLENVCKSKESYPQFVAIMCISSVIISNFGFSNLVEKLFTLFGYFGIVGNLVPVLFFTFRVN